jgi:hypothetical protein
VWPLSVDWPTECHIGGVVPGCLLRLGLVAPQAMPKEAEVMVRRWLDRTRALTGAKRAFPFRATPWDEKKFFNPNRGGWMVAENGRHISDSWALLLASRWDKDPALSELALEQLHWVAGVNPTGCSMIKGFGPRMWPNWTACIGDDTGAIMNGFMSRSDKDDRIALDDASCVTIEPWTHYNAWLLVTLAEWSERTRSASDVRLKSGLGTSGHEQ